MKNQQYYFVLLFLIGAVLIKQVLWIGFIPMWQFPDEQAHFAEVQNYAESNPINPAGRPNTSKEIDLSEIYLETKRDGFGNNKYTYHPEYNISYSHSTIGKYEDNIKNFPQSYRSEFVTNEATAYPPLYYRIASNFYTLVYSFDLITRVFMTRILNVIILLLLVIVIFKISQIIFAKSLLNQTTLVILVSFHPMLSFLGGGINSDNLFILLFSVGIYLSLRVLNKGWTIKDLIFMLGTILLSIWTKEMGKLLLIVFIFPIAYWIFKNEVNLKKSFLVLFILIAFMFYFFNTNITNLINGEQFISEIPGLPILLSSERNSYLNHLIYTGKHTYQEVIPWYWGVFRWLSLTYPRPVHRIINWTLIFSLIGIFYVLYRDINHKSQNQSKNIIFLLYTCFMYFFAITTFDYLFFISHGFSLGIQGRYFFPTIVAHMALIQIGIKTLADIIKKEQVIIKSLGISMILLHSYAQYFVFTSYYSARSSLLFFQQASQYKPVFFKTPYLEIISLLYVIILGYFLCFFCRWGKSINRN